MVAYSFKQQFVEPIRAGLGLPTAPHTHPKLQTIRANRKRHARPGEILQLYRGMRTKHCFLIGRAWCTATWPILLDFKAERVEIAANPSRLAMRKDIELDDFAWSDGFEDWAAMRSFWRDTHDIARFEGAIVHWAARKDGRRAQ
jgi:hypothetical protein